MTINEQFEEGAALELRREGEIWRHYLHGQPVTDGTELELRLSKRSEVWLSGMYEWNGDPMKSPTFAFYIETGMGETFWQVKFRLKDYGRFRWPAREKSVRA